MSFWYRLTSKVGSSSVVQSAAELASKHASSPEKNGRLPWWDDEDGSSWPNIVLRGAQTLFAFVLLCIYISLASFQAKWDVGPSFLVGAALAFVAIALIQAALFLAAPVLYDRLSFLRGLAHVLRQVRPAFILNSVQVFLMIIFAVATTVSANIAGCKNAEDDPHADLEGYTDALPGFCRDKRAAAAFFWLNFIAWSVSLVGVLLLWYRIRTNPRSTAFRVSEVAAASGDHDGLVGGGEGAYGRTGAHDAPPGMDDDGAFDAEEPNYTDGRASNVRGSYDYYGQSRVFAESSSALPEGYGGASQTDPFADRNQSSASLQYESRPTRMPAPQYQEEEDPYSLIRQSMEQSSNRKSYQYQ